MTADRELDAFIAEHIMGMFRCTGFYPAEHSPDCFEEGMTFHPGPGILSDMPHYSSNPAACGQLKARLRELGVSFSVRHHSEGMHYASSYDHAYGKGIVADADAEEMAVAMLARKLKESGVIQ